MEINEGLKEKSDYKTKKFVVSKNLVKSMV